MTYFSDDFGKDSELDLQTRLIDRASRGDTAAFLLVVARYQGRMCRFISGLVGNLPAAEAVLTDTFTITYLSLERRPRNLDFRGFLYRTCVAESRRLELGRESSDDQSTHERVKDNPSIDGVLRRLPFEARAALLLRELEQFRYEQIASILRCPVPMVGQRIFIAREILSKCFSVRHFTLPHHFFESPSSL
jgi:RNA polymerase sigma-70 factor (ECF subfamily)